MYYKYNTAKHIKYYEVVKLHVNRLTFLSHSFPKEGETQGEYAKQSSKCNLASRLVKDRFYCFSVANLLKKLYLLLDETNL